MARGAKTAQIEPGEAVFYSTGDPGGFVSGLTF